MCAFLSGTLSRSLITPLPFVALAGIASLALFCRTISSFFKSRPRSYSVNLNSTEKFRYNTNLGCKLSGLSNKLSNLRQLVLTLVQENGCDLLRITPILDACPLLEKFHLSMVESTFNGRQVEKSATFHPSLKQVRLSGFCGTRNQMSFALYILKSAVVLGQMSISPRFCYYVRDGMWFEKNASSSWDEEKRRMIQEQLQGQAISKSAKIITL